MPLFKTASSRLLVLPADIPRKPPCKIYPVAAQEPRSGAARQSCGLHKSVQGSGDVQLSVKLLTFAGAALTALTIAGGTVSALEPGEIISARISKL